MSLIPKRYQVLNQTITASGNSGTPLTNISNHPQTYVEGVLSILGPVTGTNPTLLVTVYAVDAVSGLKMVLFQFASQTAVTPLALRMTAAAVLEGGLYVDWVIGGTASPTFNAVHLDLYLTPDAIL